MFGHNNVNLVFYVRPYHLYKTVLPKYYMCDYTIIARNAAILQQNSWLNVILESEDVDILIITGNFNFTFNFYIFQFIRITHEVLHPYTFPFVIAWSSVLMAQKNRNTSKQIMNN